MCQPNKVENCGRSTCSKHRYTPSQTTQRSSFSQSYELNFNNTKFKEMPFELPSQKLAYSDESSGILDYDTTPRAFLQDTSKYNDRDTTPLTITPISQTPSRSPENGSETSFVPQNCKIPQPKKTRCTTCDEDNLKNDSINMLSVLISTVMLLASEADNIPQTYINWSTKYLNCIKNLQGQYPENVRKILMMLSNENDKKRRNKKDDRCKCPHLKIDKRCK